MFRIKTPATAKDFQMGQVDTPVPPAPYFERQAPPPDDEFFLPPDERPDEPKAQSPLERDPDFKERLARAYEIHEQNERENRGVIVDLGIEGVPEIHVRVSCIDLEPDKPHKPTVCINGGSVSSVDALKVMGCVFAAMGYRGVMVPHMMNKDVTTPGNDRSLFVNWFYETNKQEGDFVPDGMIMRDVLMQLNEQGWITDQTAVLGYSAGVPVWMRTLDGLTVDTEEDRELLEKFKAVVCINPAGAVPSRLVGKYRRLVQLARLGVGVGVDTVITYLDRTEWLLEMGDAGNLFWTWGDMVRQGYRAISDVMVDIGSRLNMPLIVMYGRNDMEVRRKHLEEVLDQLERDREQRYKSPTMARVRMKGTHLWPVQKGMGVAIAANRLLADICGFRAQWPEKGGD